MIILYRNLFLGIYHLEHDLKSYLELKFPWESYLNMLHDMYNMRVILNTECSVSSPSSEN